MKILLHMCCGPCAAYPIKALGEEGIEYTGVFFNPNIHPVDEFNRRKENLEILSKEKKFNVLYFDDYDQYKWENYNGEISSRCYMCYALRFDKTAYETANNGYEAFSTTLLVSPYQKHEMIIEICNSVADKYNVKFLYRDWRDKFREGQAIAKEHGLYRQKYCGCINSMSYKSPNINHQQRKPV